MLDDAKDKVPTTQAGSAERGLQSMIRKKILSTKNTVFASVQIEFM